MTRSIDLYELQEVDTAIDVADRRLLEIDAALDDEGGNPDLDERIQAVEAALPQAEQEQREAGEAIEDNRAKTAVLETRLYSGEVKAAKELKNLQADVDAHKKHLVSLEERALAAMTLLEQTQAELRTLHEEREAAAEERRQLVAALTSERREIGGRLEELRSQRERRATRVDRPDLALYERLRRARAGRAVAKVERGTCQGCRITLPTTVFQRARSGLKMVQCTSCERILYVV